MRDPFYSIVRRLDLGPSVGTLHDGMSCGYGVKPYFGACRLPVAHFPANQSRSSVALVLSKHRTGAAMRDLRVPPSLSPFLVVTRECTKGVAQYISSSSFCYQENPLSIARVP